jgi:hypothetical protein
MPLTLLESGTARRKGTWPVRSASTRPWPQPRGALALYARSMVSERRGDIAAMERDLRAMLRLDPDSALAMNALGYSSPT